MDEYYNMNVEIVDTNILITVLATMQLNSTTVLSPALTSLNQFFAQVVARYSKGYFSCDNSSYWLYYRQSCRLGNFQDTREDEF